MNDLIAVLISFAYVFSVLGVAEGLRITLKWNVESTRKFVHIGVGMWAFGTAVLFQSKWFALIPPLAFVLINYISYRRILFVAMESEDESNLGTIYFPIAFAAMILLWFDLSKALFIASLMPLTWGDPLAAVIGKRFGQHRYTIQGMTRSVEGSVALLVASALSIFLPLQWFFDIDLTVLLYQAVNSEWGPIIDVIGPYNLPESYALAGVFAVVIGWTAALVESRSTRGLDNLTVPGVVAMVCLVLYVAFAIPITQSHIVLH
jgi:phytol kinase